MSNFRHSLFLSLILLIPNLAWSYTTDNVISIQSPGFSERLAKGVLYLEDTSGTMSLEEVRKADFFPFAGNTLQMGYTQSAQWLKFAFRNDLPVNAGSSLDEHFYLSVRYPLLDHIDLYQRRGSRTEKLSAGDMIPYDARPLNINSFVFPISISSGETVEILMRVQSTSSISIPLFLETETSFAGSQHTFDMTNGIYLGIALGLLVYNLFLWIGVRKKVYGLYVFVTLNLLLFNLAMMGYISRFFSDAIHFQQIGPYFFGASTAAAVTAFGIAFLRTKKLQPQFHKLLVAAAFFYVLCVPIMYFSTPIIAAKLNVAVLLSGLPLLFIAAIRSTLKGYQPAIYFLIGQGAVLFGVLFAVLSSQGIIPLFYLAPDVMKWASAFELIIFSIGVADLVNHEKRLRAQAQDDAAKAQRKLLTAQIEQNEKLDELVTQRTLELESVNERLKDLSNKDELTGLRNRRYLSEVFPKQYLQAFREKQQLAALMIDIDDFKKLNDSYGHQFGDLCLSTAGDILKANLQRPSDVAIRYGGEEFLIILPNTPIEGAQNVAEAIRAEFESTFISDGHHGANLTVSIGAVSEIPENREAFTSMLNRADELLYQAKRSGRNQVKTI